MKRKGTFFRLRQTFSQLSIDLSEDHVSAYATMASFFLVLSVIPMIFLLFTLIQYLPVSKNDVMSLINMIFPSSILPLIRSSVNEIYAKSSFAIPITILLAIWSAGKAIMALSRGLNAVHDMIETRNYFVLRLSAALYTVFFVLAIAAMLVLQVFGVQLAEYLNERLPITREFTRTVLSYRSYLTLPFVVLVAWTMYILLPNKKIRKKDEIPGAVFTAFAWFVMSRIFSKFTQIFKGFSNMYGSMTMLILFLMWISLCMYVLLLGAEINLWLKEYDIYSHVPFVKKNHKAREERFIAKERRHNMELMRKQAEKAQKSEPGRMKSRDLNNKEK